MRKLSIGIQPVGWLLFCNFFFIFTCASIILNWFDLCVGLVWPSIYAYVWHVSWCMKVYGHFIFWCNWLSGSLNYCMSCDKLSSWCATRRWVADVQRVVYAVCAIFDSIVFLDSMHAESRIEWYPNEVLRRFDNNFSNWYKFQFCRAYGVKIISKIRLNIFFNYEKVISDRFWI